MSELSAARARVGILSGRAEGAIDGRKASIGAELEDVPPGVSRFSFTDEWTEEQRPHDALLFRPVPFQQPGGKIGDTPGVGAAPEALAGNTVAGEASVIDTPSRQAELFGLGTTAALGSMPVPPAPLASAGMVPGAGLAGTCEIDSGGDAGPNSSPPGVELHVTDVAVPAGAVAAMVPVALPICPVSGDISAAVLVVGTPVLVTIGVAGTGAGNADGGAQVTTVPGVVGSEASGTGASVVSGVFGSVVAENGPGLLSGEITIAPGTVGRPMAVLPIVAT